MKKEIIAGILGSLGLLLFYFIVMSVSSGSWASTISQFQDLWYWMILLSAGFGIQIGLYVKLKVKSEKLKVTNSGKAMAATSGTTSGVSMIACCAHHLSEVLPIIGLSGAAVFLAKYQLPFIMLGVFSNLVGITIMLGIIQRNELYPRINIFKHLFNYNMRTVRSVVIILSILIISGSFLLVSCKATSQTTDQGSESEPSGTSEKSARSGLDLKTNDENGVTFEIKPVSFGFEDPVKFDVSINTHQGDLDFDLTKISVLKDANGALYEPLKWEGDPPEGHHRSGALSFPKLKEKTKFMELTIKNVYGVPERVFKWELK